MTSLPCLLAVLFLFAQQPPIGTGPEAANGSVRGKVVNAVNGEPIRKARVMLRSTAGNYATDADASGNFNFAAAPGNYEVVASRPRFNIASSVDIPRIKLASGQNVTDLVLRLTPLGAIAGRIMDSEGDPMPGVGVEALQCIYAKGREQLQSVQTVSVDDRGEYRLFDLLPGRYYIRTASSNPIAIVGGVAVSGSPSTETFLGDSINAARATPVDVPAGGEISGADIRVLRASGYSVRGRLLGGFGQVSIQRPADQRVSSIRIASSMQSTPGRFEFSALTPGTWILRAQAANLISLDRQGRPISVGPSSLREALRVVEIVDRDVDGVELTFAPQSEINGVVKVVGSVPVTLANQRIQFQGAAGTSFSSVLAADGTFAIRQASPDIYQVAMNPPGSAFVTSMKLGDRQFLDRKLDLQQGGAGTLTITVSAEFGQIAGQVSGRQGAPAAGATVMLVPDQDSPDSYQTVLSDAQGSFSFTGIRPAHYRVFAWPDPPKAAPPDQLGASIVVDPNGRHSVELKLIGG